VGREAGVQRIVAQDATPRLAGWQEGAIRVFAVAAFLYSIYYIGWRWAATLNPDALWFAVPLAAAETYGLITSFFLLFTVWKLRRRQPRPTPEGLSVDVFITTYDEPLEVIRRTALGAREIRYPHSTYLLDDGKRDELRALADELDIGYIRREGNEHAKAGNLNNALKETRGEFILQLDADHVPLPHILDRLLGFFDDPRVAFVQSPQDFYNTDSFTHDVDESARRMWEEQRIFFSLIQPGKDHWNAAFFCGSCGIVRRTAFEEIGGFSTETITEDMETSLILHGRGWKSVYYGESLAYGLAPGSAGAFHVQRLRWGQGSMQILRKFNPLTHPGLTLAQRICYFASVSSYLDGLQKLVLYLAPVVFFLTGIFPIRVDNQEFLWRFVPYLVLSITSFELLSRGTGYLWIAERYNMAKFFTYIHALSGYFARGKLKFNVTPKGAGHVPFRTYAPQLALVVVSAASLAWATAAWRLGWVNYEVAGWGSLAFWLNGVWLAWNFALAGYVVQLSLRLKAEREDHRFTDLIPVRMQVRDQEGREARSVVVLTENLNPTGMAFRTSEPLPQGSRIETVLPLSTGDVRVRGRVLHRGERFRNGSSFWTHGVQFAELDTEACDAIELHCTHHAVPIYQLQYGGPSELQVRSQRLFTNTRAEKRGDLFVAAEVSVNGESRRRELALLEEVSGSGARLLFDRPVLPGTRVHYEVPGTRIEGEGEVVFSRALETPLGVRFTVGVRRSEKQPRTALERFMNGKRLSATTTAMAAVIGGLMAAAPVQAQWAPVVFGSAEADTEDSRLFLLGASVEQQRVGLAPTFGVIGYHLTYPTVATSIIPPTEVRGTQTATAVNPRIGLRNQWEFGAIQANVGYLFIAEDENRTAGPIGAPGGGQDGVTTAVQMDYWGTGAVRGQGILNYNWGGEYFWTRLRGAVPIAPALAIGAEGIVQGGGTGPGEKYQAAQAGALLEFDVSPNLRLTGGGGVKFDNLDFTADAFPYFKAEFVFIP
jgi:cellulose synthase (UDP-forming)